MMITKIDVKKVQQFMIPQAEVIAATQFKPDQSSITQTPGIAEKEKNANTGTNIKEHSLLDIHKTEIEYDNMHTSAHKNVQSSVTSSQIGTFDSVAKVVSTEEEYKEKMW